MHHILLSLLFSFYLIPGIMRIFAPQIFLLNLFYLFNRKTAIQRYFVKRLIASEHVKGNFSFAFCFALDSTGRYIAIRMPIIAMTTSASTSEKPRRSMRATFHYTGIYYTIFKLAMVGSAITSHDFSRSGGSF